MIEIQKGRTKGMVSKEEQMKNEWNLVINADVQKHVKSSELKKKQKNYTPFHL